MRVFHLIGLAALVSFASASSAQEADPNSGSDGIGTSIQSAGDVVLTRTSGDQLSGGVGDLIFLGDVAATGDLSRYKVSFTDNTALTVGPNAAITFDQFVFDPANDVADVGLRLARGSLRFVSGALEDVDNPQVNVFTSSGTVGIRGTIAEVVAGADQIRALPGFEAVTLDANPVLVVLAGPGTRRNSFDGRGAVTVSQGNRDVVLRRQNTGVILSESGIGEPFQVDDELNRELAGLIRTPPPSGSPSNDRINQSGVEASRLPITGPSISSIDTQIILAAAASGAIQIDDPNITLGELLDEQLEPFQRDLLAIPDELTNLTAAQAFSAQGVGTYSGSNLVLSDSSLYDLSVVIDFDNRTLGFRYFLPNGLASFPNRPTVPPVGDDLIRRQTLVSAPDRFGDGSEPAIVIYEFSEPTADPLNPDIERFTATIQGENGIPGSSVKTQLEFIEPGINTVSGTEILPRQ